ncbi:hypothetical protein PPL_04462 [Heterostelium album PN500]|uniref:Uncharacterized protein n=1 Tax=Heterostelium pallidum (strain ATCC 26659 / Pp 5 / PN500) TaxID=670386 RepID=D3B7M4_HETP5|nr:hypothetical protein PPL_04462 [Heterostelium album PN500]EFA82767.1 hypothetical protein PPL_04462 [Heterostelium album PN500]|eukprot:XP_020434884.1 hypothetical protein PPL_04462 [Heterostelium album PN500]
MLKQHTISISQDKALCQNSNRLKTLFKVVLKPFNEMHCHYSFDSFKTNFIVISINEIEENLKVVNDNILQYIETYKYGYIIVDFNKQMDTRSLLLFERFQKRMNLKSDIRILIANQTFECVDIMLDILKYNTSEFDIEMKKRIAHEYDQLISNKTKIKVCLSIPGLSLNDTKQLLEKSGYNLQKFLFNEERNQSSDLIKQFVANDRL